jgi:hypothetical protein
LTICGDIVQIILKGDFDRSSGWKHAASGASTGISWGAATFQGLIPYYFQILNPRRALDLDHCLHNNMNLPRSERLTIGNDTVDYCFAPDCQDCRDYNIRDLYSVHFASCLRPWTCQRHGGDNPKTSLCRDAHRAWFEHRAELEMSWGRSGRGGNRDNVTNPSLRGYCSAYGKTGYEPIRLPYGKPIQRKGMYSYRPSDYSPEFLKLASPSDYPPEFLN